MKATTSRSSVVVQLLSKESQLIQEFFNVPVWLSKSNRMQSTVKFFCKAKQFVGNRNTCKTKLFLQQNQSYKPHTSARYFSSLTYSRVCPILGQVFGNSSSFNRMSGAANEVEANTQLIDAIIDSNPSIRVRDRAKVEKLLKNLIDGGAEKLQLVIDFDHTLTKTHNEVGEKVDCSWGVMENSSLLSQEYTAECNAIKAKYLPIEHDPKMSIEDKIPHMVAWYTEANRALQKSGVRKSDFSAMVAASNVEFRDATSTMLTILAGSSIPVLVLSAGIGDLIVEILQSQGVFHDNIKVVSNFLAFDDEGHVIGLDGEIIHVYNKNENAIHNSDYFKVLQSRQNVILVSLYYFCFF